MDVAGDLRIIREGKLISSGFLLFARVLLCTDVMINVLSIRNDHTCKYILVGCLIPRIAYDKRDCKVCRALEDLNRKQSMQTNKP